MPQADSDVSNYGGDQRGGAALSLIEALMLVLVERGVLREDEIDSVFEAAIKAHERQAQGSNSASSHQAISRMLKRIQVRGNAVRLE